MTHPGPALLAMLLVQLMVSLTLVSASVLAPAVAPTLGIAPERIGLYAGLAYLLAMLSGLRSGQWVARIGAMRLTQAGLLACMAGACLAGLGPPSTLLLSAALIGLGYGVVNPAAAAVLTQHAPVNARGLFFSAKQTGVPLGVATAGLTMPLGLALLGWRPTAVLVGLGCGALAVALNRWVRPLEPPPNDRPPSGAWALLAKVWRSPVLRPMSLASFSYAGTQQVFVTFLVSQLNLSIGWTLATAAALLAVSQAVSATARIGFGWVGDRWAPPSAVLVGLGLAMSLCCAGLSMLSPQTPAWVVGAAALGMAATAMGWNGVFIAALAQRVPRDEMARISGATQFFTFTGGMSCPLLFGEALRAGSSYTAAYLVLGAVPAAAALALARAVRRHPQGA
jgi:MFS family permease